MPTPGGDAGCHVTGILGWISAMDGRVRLKRISGVERVGGDHFAGGVIGTGKGVEGAEAVWPLSWGFSW